jgi:hypothetical protein
MRRTLKELVLEQMCESGSTGSFVRGSDVVPQIHRHNWRRVVLRQRYKKPVI